MEVALLVAVAVVVEVAVAVAVAVRVEVAVAVGPAAGWMAMNQGAPSSVCAPLMVAMGATLPVLPARIDIQLIGIIIRHVDFAGGIKRDT